ncbi:MAG TPA: O-antigen ligase family protein [Thermoanaerobaculia bacterium]|nr:O-antigen ligase family protein [Thermoanaerobaculia bacterium]
MSHRRSRRPKPPPPPSPPPPAPGERAAAFVLTAAIVASTLIVDVRAEAPFEAPQRFAATLGCAAAAALAFTRAARPGAALRPAGRIAALLFAAALAAAGVSALLSPRSGAALDSWRAMLLAALAVPLGSALTDAGFRVAAIGFLGAAVVSSLLALAEAAGWRGPLPIESVSGRSATGAMLGNEGLLSIVLAVAAIAALAAALSARRPLERRLAGAALLPIAAALVVNRNLTSAVAAASGAAIVGFRLAGRRAIRVVAAAALAAAAGVAAYGPARARVREAAGYLRAADWNRLLSYREGPWVAAIEMIRDRPLLGYGPGTFGAEFVPHRLAAEIRRRARFVNPRSDSAYVEAHCDYLQAAAEAGLPAAAAAAGGLGVLLAALWRRTSAGPAPLRASALGLFAVLCAGAVSALTWFPLQRPASALPLLLATGRAWKVAGTGEDPA